MKPENKRLMVGVGEGTLGLVLIGKGYTTLTGNSREIAERLLLDGEKLEDVANRNELHQYTVMSEDFYVRNQIAKEIDSCYFSGVLGAAILTTAGLVLAGLSLYHFFMARHVRRTE